MWQSAKYTTLENYPLYGTVLWRVAGVVGSGSIVESDWSVKFMTWTPRLQGPVD